MPSEDEDSEHYRSYVKSLGKLKSLAHLKIFPHIKLESHNDHKSKWAPQPKFQRLLLRFIWDKLPALHTLDVIGDFTLTASQCTDSLGLVERPVKLVCTPLVAHGSEAYEYYRLFKQRCPRHTLIFNALP